MQSALGEFLDALAFGRFNVATCQSRSAQHLPRRSQKPTAVPRTVPRSGGTSILGVRVAVEPERIRENFGLALSLGSEMLGGMIGLYSRELHRHGAAIGNDGQHHRPGLAHRAAPQSSNRCDLSQCGRRLDRGQALLPPRRERGLRPVSPEVLLIASPTTAKLCIIDNECTKCPIAQARNRLRALDNGVLSCVDPKALLRTRDALP